jgi:formimidoylglutamate deiminase
MTTLWADTALLPSGWTSRVRIEITRGVIRDVIADTPPLPADERHAIAIPGLSNVHCHAFQRGMAGLAEHRSTNADNFWSWREVMYQFLDHLTPDDVEVIAAMAYAEMLESGYTRVGEFHYLHNDVSGARYDNPAEMASRIVAAATATGIGLTLLPVFYAHSNFGGVPPVHGQRRFLSTVESFGRLLEASTAYLPTDANLGIAPHSLRAVTSDELRVVIAMHPRGPIHIHAAEQVKEVEASIAFSGARPVQWLLDNASVDQRWCLIHATHMTEMETDALAASGAVAGLCPITEANLGDGIFPTARYLREGGHIATGTDSNILIDAAQELRALEYAQRLTHRARNVLTRPDQPSVARNLFDATLAGGARALGVTQGIAVGTAAEIVTLQADHPAVQGRRGDQLLDAWVFASRTGCIDSVWRGGHRLVSHGQHRDAESITRRYLAVVERILAS